MPRTIGDLISSGVEQAALEGQGGGMMAFLMAMKGVQGIAETLQNMEAEKRVNKKWEWEQEDREVEVMQRDSTKSKIEKERKFEKAIAGEGVEGLDPVTLAQVRAALAGANASGTPEIKDAIGEIASALGKGSTKAGDINPAAFSAAKSQVRSFIESEFKFIEYTNRNNPDKVAELKQKTLKDLWKSNREVITPIMWDALMDRGGEDPFLSDVKVAIGKDKSIASVLLGLAETVDKSSGTTKDPSLLRAVGVDESKSADIFAMLEELKSGGDPNKFLESQNIQSRLVPIDKKGEDRRYLYEGKPKTNKELSSIMSDQNTRLRFAREIRLGLHNPEKAKSNYFLQEYEKNQAAKAAVAAPIIPGGGASQGVFGGYSPPIDRAYTPDPEDLPPTDVFGNNLPGQAQPPAAPMEELRSLPPEKLDALMQIISQMYNPRFKPVDKTQEPLRNRYPGPRRDMLR